ncbi:DUF5752 family protein [Thioalkalivibrio sp. ARh3]|uniref:DUF5752 family protein n=1 Tax=Thioalkalivibrio sp. ARh3 TaxID=1158148 RepID=UPI000380B90F|nr:DUF5752 family protein [Thioalkalivibrio sp. ARh3]
MNGPGFEHAPPAAPFRFRDCALIPIASGRRASSLKELRDHLVQSGRDTLYYHFWGALLQPRFEEREYHNDFAAWVHHAVRDDVLAEQLAMVDPDEYDDVEELRLVILEYIDQRLEDTPFLEWIPATQVFEFIHAQIVVFDAGFEAGDYRDLAGHIPRMPLSSVFYHFVDARRRTPDRTDDFSAWLAGFDREHQELVDALADIDPYFNTLSELRDQLGALFRRHFGEGVA